MNPSITKAVPLRLARLGGVALLAMAAWQPALSADVSLSGWLAQDDSVQTFLLTLSAPGSVSVTSIGYAGGSRFNGSSVAAGGFDSVLYLFSSTGALLAQSDDGIGVPADPATGEALDAAFTTASLAAGEYLVALAQADNYLLGFNLSDGFAQTGNGSFSAAFGCSNGSFCDYQGNNRTSAWSINFSGQTLTSVLPEPGSMALLLGAFGALVALRRREGAAAARQPEVAPA